MTGLEYLQKRARIIYFAPFLPLLPGFIAWLASIFVAGSTNIFARFCIDYWYVMMMAGSLLAFLAIVIGVRFLLCPFCRFRLTTAGAGPIQFVSGVSKVKYCPNCGVNLSDKLSHRNVV